MTKQPAYPRRRFLRAALSGAGWALLAAQPGGSAFAQSASVRAASSPLRETPLRGGLLQLSGAGGNIVLLPGASGIAMVDSGSLEHGEQLLEFVAERFGGAPVEILFNTHWHLDHTGGNEAAGRAGAKIIAHENTRLWMAAEFYVDWQDRSYPARPAAAQPTDTFYSSDPQPIALTYSGQRIEYGHLREAHTDGDIYVSFPEHNVIVAGGAVTVGQYPVLDYITGGLIGGLIDATRKLIEMSDPETLIVPAVGPVQMQGHLDAQLAMLSAMRERIEALARQGRSAEEMFAAGIAKEFDAYWGNNAERFISNVYDGRWGISR